MTRVWDKERIRLAKEYLANCESVSDAVDQLNEDGIECTCSSIRKGFTRAGEPPPSVFLNGPPDAPQEPEEGATPKEKEERDFEIDFEARVYLVKYNKTRYCVPFDSMCDYLVMYTDHPPGKGMTSREVAQASLMRGEPYGGNQEFFQHLFRTIGFNKSMFPAAPHEIYKNEEELRKAAYVRRDALIKGEVSRDIVKVQHKRIAELEDKIEDIERIISMNDLSIREAQVYKLEMKRRPGVDSRDGYEVGVIPFSDLHSGKFVKDMPLSKPQNIFNMEVYWDRIGSICEYAHHYVKNSRADEFIIAGLGDYFEALLLNMRAYHFMAADSFGAEQYQAVVDGWKAIIKTVKDAADGRKATVIVQGGNHDRLTQERDAGTEEILAFQIAMHLKDYFDDEEGLDIEFGAGVVSIMLPNGVNYLSLHGHKSPLKTEKDFANFIQVHGFPYARRYVIFQGHWHSTKIVTGYNFRAIWVASVCGDDRYNLEKLNVGCRPEVAFVTIGEDNERFTGPFRL